MTITHHPDAYLLMDYASGALAEPVALVVATHTALCPACRADVARFERAAGLLLNSAEPDEISDKLKASIMDRLDETAPEPPRPAPVGKLPQFLPEPLRSYAGQPVAREDWHRWGSGVRQIRLLENRSDCFVRLAKIRACARMPEHSHRGEEYTLVLSGGFSDATGHYLRGDVAEMGVDDYHQPVADKGDDCICLIVATAPVQLKGLIGSMINPFLRT